MIRLEQERDARNAEDEVRRVDRELRRLRAEAPELREQIQELEARQRALAVPRRRGRVRDSGIGLGPGDLERVASDDLEDTQALRAVRRWAADATRPWLFLLGPVGTGKTVAAAWAIAEHTGRCTRSSRLVDVMFPRYDDPRHGRPEVDAGLFVLDDLGGEVPSPRFGAALFELVDRRLDAPTIVTANLTPAQARERYDGRVVDRWRHVGAVVRLSGPSLRQQDGGL